MGARNQKFWKYYKQYEVAQMKAMMNNGQKDPLICTDRFDNKLLVITGATSGIGYHTAKKYASMGADLLCINRSEEKSIQLKAEIESGYQVKCDYLIADLGKINEIHAVADQLSALERDIDVLIHNAGLTLSKQQLTDEGYDLIFVVQYLASFIINYKLIEKLKVQESARIVMNNSEGHRFAPWGLHLDDLQFKKRRYSGLKAYGSAKLAQLLSMQIFREKFESSGVTINAMHPGAVKSDTGKDNGPLYKWYKRNILDKFLRPTHIASDALYYLGVSKDLENTSGKFFHLTTEEIPAPPAWDVAEAKKLWDISLELCNLKAQ
ncbi:MAG: SDR family NAD(P)-dependent oxidoreductase [Prolixibacteraceae bacterium]|nr:SDR family NAD(P)-dependent oxidoreductase [Prolixibacteraceae bacterium]